MRFQDLLDDAAGYAADRQRRLEDLLAQANYFVDLDARTITFTAPGKAPIVTRMQVLGTESAGEFLWSWANHQMGLPDELTEVAHSLRDFGEEHGVPELTEPLVKVTDLVNGYTLACVAIRAALLPGLYRFATPNGPVVYLVLTGPEVETPPTDPGLSALYFPRVLMLPISDHQRALRGYFEALGIVARATEAGLVGEHPRGTVLAQFDEQGRLANIQGGLSAPRGGGGREDGPGGAPGGGQPPTFGQVADARNWMLPVGIVAVLTTVVVVGLAWVL